MSNANVDAVVRSTSRENDREPLALLRRGAPRKVRVVRETRTAASSMAVAKWAETRTGWRSPFTTIPPRIASVTIKANAATAGTTIQRILRYATRAATARIPTRMLSTITSDRWLNSISAWYSTGGSRRPGSHPGQLGQPSPEPVARTSAPTPISVKVAAVAAMHRVRKRFTAGHSLGGARRTREVARALWDTPHDAGARCGARPPTAAGGRALRRRGDALRLPGGGAGLPRCGASRLPSAV